VLPTPKPIEASTHADLGCYLLLVFGYAGRLPFSREYGAYLWSKCAPATCSIYGEHPGHAVLADVAGYPQSNQRYLPAQNIRVLRNTMQPALGAWFAVTVLTKPFVETPRWAFVHAELVRFK
jgi:hypothetical protein